MFILNFIALV